jgi:hypothetical protein
MRDLIALATWLNLAPTNTCKKAKHKATNTQSSNTHGFHVGASFVHPSIHPSIHSFICPSIHPSIHSFICSSIHPSIHSFICSSIHPSIHLSIHSFICLFVHSFALLLLIGTREAIILKMTAGMTERSAPTN